MLCKDGEKLEDCFVLFFGDDVGLEEGFFEVF